MANKTMLPAAVTRALWDQAPTIAHRALETIAAEVPTYAAGVGGPAGDVRREEAILVAITGWLRLTGRRRSAEPADPEAEVLEAAYDFGRFEARLGRTIDALLAAYRIGARAAWHDLSAEMISGGVRAATIADGAELLFAYIDHLSAASVAGHHDELASAGRAHERQIEQLTRWLLDHAPAHELEVLAEAASWDPPVTLTAVVLPAAQARPALQRLDHRTLLVVDEQVDDAPANHAVLLVPDVHRDRPALLQALRGRDGVVGPTRPWFAVAESHHRAVRASRLPREADGRALDADAHLAELVIGADHEALADLRARVLAPLDGLRPATAARLADTLRSWLLHQGRREDVAADLDVHPQTVRYRMGQVRELFGDHLTSPSGVLEIVVALATLPIEPAGAPPAE